LFEPSHLSLERFVQTYQRADRPDVVRNWQDVKESELRRKRPVIGFVSLLVFVSVAAIIWKRKEAESESLLWPLLLIYAASHLSHYYYAFLCLFVLLFFRRASSFGVVPLSLLLLVNLAALATKYAQPSPIVFYTLLNVYLFLGLSSILAFALYASVLGKTPALAVASSPSPHEPPRREAKRRRRPPRPRRK
jgi:hypothetical protein